jgi:hypothetical protein
MYHGSMFLHVSRPSWSLGIFPARPTRPGSQRSQSADTGRHCCAPFETDRLRLIQDIININIYERIIYTYYNIHMHLSMTDICVQYSVFMMWSMLCKVHEVELSAGTRWTQEWTQQIILSPRPSMFWLRDFMWLSIYFVSPSVGLYIYIHIYIIIYKL